jgi:hypothetical protein
VKGISNEEKLERRRRNKSNRDRSGRFLVVGGFGRGESEEDGVLKDGHKKNEV